MEEEENQESKDNEIIIAGRDFSTYNQTILNKLLIHDQIILVFLKTYEERAEAIARQWEAVGVLPVSYKSHGRLIVSEKEENVYDKTKNKYFKAIVCRMKLSKLPELFKFTKIE